jgi:hypothetical protein
MQQIGTDSSGSSVVYRNDPSTNCFGYPSIQFDSLPVEGGKPNGITIDWSLMVDELQMQDDDRLHIHLPGFTGKWLTPSRSSEWTEDVSKAILYRLIAFNFVVLCTEFFFSAPH